MLSHNINFKIKSAWKWNKPRTGSNSNNHHQEKKCGETNFIYEWIIFLKNKNKNDFIFFLISNFKEKKGGTYKMRVKGKIKESHAAWKLFIKIDILFKQDSVYRNIDLSMNLQTFIDARESQCDRFGHRFSHREKKVALWKRKWRKTQRKESWLDWPSPGLSRWRCSMYHAL